jgi:hypothetical protein
MVGAAILPWIISGAPTRLYKRYVDFVRDTLNNLNGGK